jgi:hypothetical protein
MKEERGGRTRKKGKRRGIMKARMKGKVTREGENERKKER